jgi:hypothetical protein
MTEVITVWLDQVPPDLPRATRCRSCGALIVYLTTKVGNLMPFDAAPTPALTNVRRAENSRGWYADISGELVHWRTCPYAAEWLRPHTTGA